MPSDSNSDSARVIVQKREIRTALKRSNISWGEKQSFETINHETVSSWEDREVQRIILRNAWRFVWTSYCQPGVEGLEDFLGKVDINVNRERIDRSSRNIGTRFRISRLPSDIPRQFFSPTSCSIDTLQIHTLENPRVCQIEKFPNDKSKNIRRNCIPVTLSYNSRDSLHGRRSSLSRTEERRGNKVTWSRVKFRAHQLRKDVKDDPRKDADVVRRDKVDRGGRRTLEN